MNNDQAALTRFREAIARLGQNPPVNSLSDEERVGRAKKTFLEKLDRDMAVDLESCIHCGMCAEACHFYEATQNAKYTPIHKIDPLRRFYRREMSPMRWLFRPFTRDITAGDLSTWRELVYDACTGCGRCDMMCPMGISLSPMINVMREGIASAGMVPDELRELQDEQRNNGTLFGVGAEQLKNLVDEFRSEGIEIPLDKDHADVLVLSTAVEILLFPGALGATARVMNKTGVNWTMLSSGFEAANAGLISGDDKTQRAATARLVERAKRIGAKTVILPESGHAYQALRWEGANEIGEPLPFEVMAISEFIAAEVEAGRIRLKPAGKGSMAYHDPCRLGRRGGVYNPPRELLDAMDIDVRETDSKLRENYCCGGGCGEYVIKTGAKLRQMAFEIKKHEFDKTGADAVVTSCANCRINLAIGADASTWKTPIVSLVETVAANLAD